MFPGYVTMYKDNDGFICLYFFKGIDDNGNHIYRDIDLTSTNTDYQQNTFSDGAIEYIFTNKRIIRITCKLIDNNNNQDIFELTL